MDRIVTARLILRRARADDLEAIHAILSHPTAMRYWSSLPHTDIQQTLEWLANMMACRDHGGDDFVIEHDGRAIGKAGCYRLPEIGYILHPDVWGRGLAAEAMAAVTAYVFANHPVEALRADVDPRNTASIRLLERLGFVPDGSAKRTWLIGEEWCDSLYFRLSRPPR